MSDQNQSVPSPLRAGVMPRRVVRAVAAAGLVGAVAALAWTPSGAHAADDATIYLVQGLPGKSVDVSVNGKTLATGMKGAQVAGPFKVKAGNVSWAFSSGGKQLLSRSMDVKSGTNFDVVLHLPAAGSGEMVTSFKNDLSAVPKGKASLTVAHVAAVGAADITVNGKVLFANVANGESLNLTVPARTYTVRLVPTGKTSPVILGPLQLAVKQGSLNRVYAFGRPSDKTMNVAVHTVAVRSTGSGAPKRVPTGTGGQAVALEPAGAAAASDPLAPFLR